MTKQLSHRREQDVQPVTRRRLKEFLLFALLPLASSCGTPRQTLSYGWDYYDRAKREHYKGENASALQDLRDAIRLEPTVGEFHVEAGVVLISQRRYGDAERELNTAVALDPRDANAYVWLSGAASRHREFLNAKQAAKNAIAIQPNNTAAWNDLGWADLGMNSNDDAAASFAQAIKLNKYEFVARNNYGTALYRQGKKREAISQWQYVSRHGTSTCRKFAHSHLNDPQQALSR